MSIEAAKVEKELQKRMRELAAEVDARERIKREKEKEEQKKKALEDKLKQTELGRKCLAHPNYKELYPSSLPGFSKAAAAQTAPYIREFSGSWEKWWESSYLMCLNTKPGSLFVYFFSYDYEATVKEGVHTRVSISLHVDSIQIIPEENGIKAVLPIKWSEDTPVDEFHPRSYTVTYKTLEELIEAAIPKGESSLVDPSGYLQCRVPLATLKQNGWTLINYAQTEYKKLLEIAKNSPRHSLPIKVILEKTALPTKKDTLIDAETANPLDTAGQTSGGIEKIQAEKLSEASQEKESDTN